MRQQVCALAEAVRQKRKLRKHSGLRLNTSARAISNWLQRPFDEDGKCFRGINIDGKFYRASNSEVNRVLQDPPPSEPARESIICVRAWVAAHRTVSGVALLPSSHEQWVDKV